MRTWLNVKTLIFNKNKSHLMPDSALPDLQPLIVISCEARSITLLVGSLQLGGAGGKRILRPNRCFFFFTSFPDMNLAETEGGVKAIRCRAGESKTENDSVEHLQAIINIINNEPRKETYTMALLFNALRTLSYRSDVGVFSSCQHRRGEETKQHARLKVECQKN